MLHIILLLYWLLDTVKCIYVAPDWFFTTQQCGTTAIIIFIRTYVLSVAGFRFPRFIRHLVVYMLSYVLGGMLLYYSLWVSDYF